MEANGVKMNRYLLRRCFAIVPTMVMATLFIFLLLRALPGDVVLTILADTPHTEEMREALREELGLKAPLPIQYLRWLRDLVNGSFGGASLHSGETLASMIRRQAPVTLLLTMYTMAVSLLLALPLGIYCALKPNKIVNGVLSAVSLAGLSLPNVLIATIVLLVLLYAFRWSPPIIYMPPGADGAEHLQMMIWPVLILAWEQASHLFRLVRTSMGEVLSKEYIKTARGRGIPIPSLVLKHSLGGVAGAILTVIGLQFGVLLGGALVLETIFGLPGIGRGLVDAALARDLPVVQSYAVILVFFFIVANLVTDTIHAAADPRIRSGFAEVK